MKTIKYSIAFLVFSMSLFLFSNQLYAYYSMGDVYEGCMTCHENSSLPSSYCDPTHESPTFDGTGWEFCEDRPSETYCALWGTYGDCSDPLEEGGG